MDKLYDPNGKVILKYFQPMPKMVKIGKKSINFESKFGVSLSFVEEEDVDPLLSYLGGCCGSKKQVIFLATQVQYDHWKFGNGGRK